MKFQRFFPLVPALLLCLVISGCAGKGKKGEPVYTGAPCQDVLTYPQDLTIYAINAGKERSLATAGEQQMAAERQRNSLYRPWRMSKASPWVKSSLEKNFNMNPARGFTRDERPITDQFWQELVSNSNKEAYALQEGPAITVRHTNLRAMPTREHYYLEPSLPGEGYPFDYFQHSSIAAGTPLYICNVSRDGQWLLVESAITAGWLPARDAARVDAAFTERWQSLPLAALVRDNTLIAGEKNHIGALLPIAGPAPKGRGQSLGVLYPRLGAGGYAVAETVALPPDSAVAVPLTFTPAEVARVGNEMMGQPYGWGGLDEKRDCSALTRDILAPFGIFLPRNSSAQARTGRGIMLEGHSAEEKESIILSNAVPFSSLVWLRGHIGLYTGQYNGKATMFHNMWGLRTKDRQGGCDGRAIVGKAVVTTLRPGVERPDLCVPGSFLDRIERAVVLPAYAEPPLSAGQ